MSLRVKLVLYTSLTLAVIFTLFSVYSLRGDRMAMEAAEQEANVLMARAVESMISQRKNIALTAVRMIAADQVVAELFASRDREGLLTLLMPAYLEISDEIAQFHFHLPDSTSFLRFHLPGSYGDSLKDTRPAVVEANARGQVVTGIEKGIGGLGYRAVVPVTFGGIHRGTVEMGSSLGQGFLEELKELYGSDYSIYDLSDREVVLSSTFSAGPFTVSDGQLEAVLAGETVFSRSADGQLGVILIPLLDFRGDTIACLEIATGREEILAALSSKQWQVTALFLLSLFLTSAVIYQLLQYSVLKPLTGINAYLEKVAALDFSSRLEVRGRDEIGLAAEGLNQTVDMISRAMDDLILAHEQTISILDSIQAVVYVTDLESFEILFMNRYGRELYGDVVGTKCWQSLQKNQEVPCPFCPRELMLQVADHEDRAYTWEIASTFNNRRYECRGSAVRWHDGRIVILVIASDITERKLAEEIILQSREWYRTLAEDIPLFICRLTPGKKFSYVNDAYCSFLGRSRAELLDADLFTVVQPKNRKKIELAFSDLTVERPVSTHEHTGISLDGGERWLRWTNRAIFDRSGMLKEYLSIGEDITEQKEHETRLEYLSLHDSLTGLYNKAYFDSEVIRIEGGRDYPVAIISADLDNLKKVNDTCGHSTGDSLLKACAEILRHSVRRGDVPARVGGDEFAIIMPRTGLQAGKNVVKRIEVEIQKYNRLHPALPMSLSIGLAVSEGPSMTLCETYIEADRIMYRQKADRSRLERL